MTSNNNNERHSSQAYYAYNPNSTPTASSV